MRLSYDNWFCCSIDFITNFELCKIKRRKGLDSKFEYYIITYYEGKEVYSGSLAQCQEWIKEHWIEKRYLDQYGKD